MSAPRRLDIQTVTGKDWWAVTFLPRPLAVRYIARRVIAAKGPPTTDSPLFFSYPGWAPREIIDADGNTRSATLATPFHP